MADFVDEKKLEMETRLRELRPLVEEYQRLEAAVAALDGMGAAGAPRNRRTRGKGPSGGTGRPGRPKGSGPRARQTLELIKAQPGVTIPELATTMGIKQNYLYRVVPGLQRDGLVRREGRGWQVVEPPPDRRNAGILADSWLFSRHGSTISNAGRGRANAISRALLCFDFQTRDIEIDASVNLADPNEVAEAVQKNPSCVACHQQLDPLANVDGTLPEGT